MARCSTAVSILYYTSVIPLRWRTESESQDTRSAQNRLIIKIQMQLTFVTGLLVCLLIAAC